MSQTDPTISTIPTIPIVLANPRGFCAGVERAIAIVEKVLERCGAPVYVRHEVVHNRFVVDNLRSQGAVFVQELDEVPDGATVIFSAHGVAQAVQDEAARRGLTVYDATCPLVTKVHLEVVRHRSQGREVIMIGHRGHPEVAGTMGQSDSGMHLVETPADVAKLPVASDQQLAYVTQTTLSMDDATAIIAALRERFPAIVGPKKDDICYATQNRQDAVTQLTKNCDVVVVVGSANSSNSNRLREVAVQNGARAYLVDRAEELQPEWFAAARRIGVTAGASAPEVLVGEVIAWLRNFTHGEVLETDHEPEGVSFPLPKSLA